ncbi:Hypothetical predicted protein [Octopus vulgaris]|uniref:Uncharacterized protein n=1 Tax=Octopus vulgaris TaxID=6645 RepID=A0AA36BSL4_OCTVU|nr:Hypothetical predicted protein [Octopus vulgaris]
MRNSNTNCYIKERHSTKATTIVTASATTTTRMATEPTPRQVTLTPKQLNEDEEEKEEEEVKEEDVEEGKEELEEEAKCLSICDGMVGERESYGSKLLGQFFIDTRGIRSYQRDREWTNLDTTHALSQ